MLFTSLCEAMCIKVIFEPYVAKLMKKSAERTTIDNVIIVLPPVSYTHQG